MKDIAIRLCSWRRNRSIFILLLLLPCCCLFSWRYNPFGCIFHSSVACFSLLIRGFLITHNDAPQSVGLLWTSDQNVAETSTWQHTTITTDKHPCLGGIRTHNLSRRAAEDLRLRTRGHWDRLYYLHTYYILTLFRYSSQNLFNNFSAVIRKGSGNSSV